MEEDEQIKLIMDKSHAEEAARQEMIRKNDELLAMLKQIEEDKPEGWGLKKINPTDVSSDNALEAYSHNMAKALKKLELQQNIEKLRAEHKEKLVAARNE